MERFEPAEGLLARLAAKRFEVPGPGRGLVATTAFVAFRNGRPCLATAYYPVGGEPPGPPVVFPPRCLLLVDAASGELLELEALENDTAPPLGTRSEEEISSWDEMRTAQRGLASALDVLIPWADRGFGPVPDLVRHTAGAYRYAWERLTPSLLNPALHPLSPSWFDLVGIPARAGA